MEAIINVVIADDHGLMRQGIAAMLEGVPDVKVIGIVSGGEEAINFTSHTVPDVFLMDIMMRGMTGIEAARWITDLHPKVRIILISSELSNEFVSTGIKAGIAGYILKDSSKDILLTAIRAVARGEQYFATEVSDHIFQNFYKSEKDSKPIAPDGISILTKRETEILKLIAEGKSLREIADQLFISIKTVETHKLNIQDKLDIHNTAKLVRYAIEKNLVKIGKP